MTTMTTFLPKHFLSVILITQDSTDDTDDEIFHSPMHKITVAISCAGGQKTSLRLVEEPVSPLYIAVVVILPSLSVYPTCRVSYHPSIAAIL
jgi:hypothetical protein